MWPSRTSPARRAGVSICTFVLAKRANLKFQYFYCGIPEKSRTLNMRAACTLSGVSGEVERGLAGVLASVFVLLY